MARHVLLVTNELATATAVSTALESNGKLAPEDVCRDYHELAARMERSPANAVLVDIDAQPEKMLASLDSLVRKYSDTRFVVLSGALKSELLLEAMQAGARHFMVKQTIAADLPGVLHRICPNGSSSAQGTAITVLSASGGAGATTIAVNLADEMSLLSGETSLIMDLDYCYGSVATYLGLEGEYGVIDLLARSGPIDGELIQTTAMLTRSEKLQALISTSNASLGDPVSLEPHRVGQTLDAAKRVYRNTVVDAPRVSLALAAELTKHSTATLLVFQLSVKDIRVAQRILTGLTERGVAASTITPIVNRYRKRGSMISIDEARRALGTFPVGYVSNDFQAASQAINLGQTLSQAAPRSDPRREIQQLAVKLSELKGAAVKAAR